MTDRMNPTSGAPLTMTNCAIAGRPRVAQTPPEALRLAAGMSVQRRTA